MHYLSSYCTTHPCATDPEALVLFSTKRAAILLVPKTIRDDIANGVLSGEEEETLAELDFLVKDAEKEKEEMLGFIDELNALNKKLNVVAVMNMDCNLACVYCFEGTRKGKLFMSRETAGALVDFIDERLDGKEELRLTFYGGEPLLSLELIAETAARMKSLCERKGVTFSAALITNGTLLTESVAQRLVPLGLTQAQITLDGPEYLHNASRPFKSGKGSFKEIIKNVKAACDIIKVQVGGNFTKENYREFPRLLDYLMGEGLGPDKISLVRFAPVMQESAEFALPEFNDGCLSINEPWLVEASIFLRKEILRRGYHTPKIVPSTCMIEMNDNLVVNYDGTLYKCPGLMGRPAFCIGSVSAGIGDYRQTHCLDNWKNDACLACAYLPLCFGGCRYSRLVREGNMNGIDCKRPYYEAALDAFVLQDAERDRHDAKADGRE
jgi:uncharacterized protein